VTLADGVDARAPGSPRPLARVAGRATSPGSAPAAGKTQRQALAKGRSAALPPAGIEVGAAQGAAGGKRGHTLATLGAIAGVHGDQDAEPFYASAKSDDAAIG
jgi:hypothetical protein